MAQHTEKMRMLGARRGLIYLWWVLAAFALPCISWASEYRGQVLFGGLGVPGAIVTVTHGGQRFTTVSDQGGGYKFADLADGPWTVEISMLCFAPLHGEMTVSATTAAGKWELALLPLSEITALAKLPSAPLPSLAVAAPLKKADAGAPAEILKPTEDSSDGLLVNGSTNNAATSKFSLDQAFGNRRYNSRSLYNGGFAAIYDNSSLDARPYSLSGLESPKASYNRFTGLFTLGGPLKIPHVLPRGPTFFVAYAWTRNSDAETHSGLVPTAAERAGDLSSLLNPLGQPVVITDPATGLPFADNLVPVSSQAAALLQLYPAPNLTGSSLYNYQVPVLTSTHRDALQLHLDKTLGRKDQVYGNFNFQNSRESLGDLFGFVDKTATLGINTNMHWSHRFSQHFFLYAGYGFSRLRTTIEPYFANRINISGEAGIGGNNQEAANWGPPALTFSGGLAPLSDQQSTFNRNRTDGFSGSAAVYRGRHNFTIGGDLRKQQYNDFFQQNPRGLFTFTGAASGSDLADFLIGVPDTSSVAFGNADKYFRQSVYDAYLLDDWRILTNLTINAGLRWEYGAPMTELHDRLVNLDVVPGFGAAAQVVATNPIGLLTGSQYPTSLIRPDKRGFEPRIGVSWRPLPASTVVVRAGYGIYDDTSVYEASVLQMAQQAPLSKTLSVANSPKCRLTLADGFSCSSVTPNTFAVDPDFRVGYAQTWQLAVQRDLPAALQLTATYLGVKGTRGLQQFLPNTYPIGAANPCTKCPAGFVYQMSGGDSTRQSAQLQLRRRLRSGFTASLLYTYSKSIDDDAVLGGEGHTVGSSTQSAAPASGGQGSGQSQTVTVTAPATQSAPSTPVIAQDWLNLHGERSLSSFDQRHVLKMQAQYTTGEGLGGGTLMSGWTGRLLKEWTVLTQIGAGSGLPLTPVYLAAVPGTGYTGTIRPDRTGAPIAASLGVQHLNPLAYTPPVTGQWGTAGRNSITGPGQFSLDAALARTFRPSGRLFFDAKVEATNVLNHPVFTGWDTSVNSSQFGVPVSPNSMRSVETTLRLRF
jgi:trimeric autotransporter adhesin